MKIKLNSSSEKDVMEGFKEFMQYSKARNLSKATLYYYRSKLNRFCDWLIKDEEIITLDEIIKQTIQRYIINLQMNYNLNDKSINTHLRAVKVFLNYCQQFAYVGDFRVKLIQTQDKVKDTYTNQELKVLLKKPNIKKVNFAEFRTWVTINWNLKNNYKSEGLLVLRFLQFE